MIKALRRSRKDDFPSITQYNAVHPRYEGAEPFSMLLQHRQFVRRLKNLKNISGQYANSSNDKRG